MKTKAANGADTVRPTRLKASGKLVRGALLFVCATWPRRYGAGDFVCVHCGVLRVLYDTDRQLDLFCPKVVCCANEDIGFVNKLHGKACRIH